MFQNTNKFNHHDCILITSDYRLVLISLSNNSDSNKISYFSIS